MTYISKLILIFFSIGIRTFCGEVKSKTKCLSRKQKTLGQPTPETHPHILNVGEVTPLITKAEYQNRRLGLVESILKNQKSKSHLVRILITVVLYWI